MNSIIHVAVPSPEHSQWVEEEQCKRALEYEEGYMDFITGRVRKYRAVPDVAYGQYLRGWRDAGGT